MEQKRFEVINVSGREHVITSDTREETVTYLSGEIKGKKAIRSIIPAPNYAGTGKALCGVLLKGETLEAWKKRTKSC